MSPGQEDINSRKGDDIVPGNQQANRYIVETLKPEAPDSFFAWNFFDAILQQKVHFFAYIFEDRAACITDENPEIRKALGNANLERDFIYRRCVHLEPEFLRYPIFSILYNCFGQNN